MYVPRVREPDVGTNPSLLGERLQTRDTLPVVGHCTRGESFGETVSLPLLPLSVWLLLSLIVEEAIYLVFCSFSGGITPFITIDVVFP